MKLKRKTPLTTLFMISSIDGKISTGKGDLMDIDKDFPKIRGLKEGLHQYYQIEQTTDLHSLNSGKVLSKIGINKCQKIKKTPVNFIVIDNKYLTLQGVKNMISKSNKLFVVTSNKRHPAFKFKDKLELIYFPKKINFKDLFVMFKKRYKINQLTIQTGGTLNTLFLRKGLINRIKFVYAPCLIGGKETPSLFDGDSLKNKKNLSMIKTLSLIKITKLKNNYIQLEYKINV